MKINFRYFFFYLKPGSEQVLILDRIKLVTLYVTALISLIGSIFNYLFLIKYDQIYPIILLILFDVFIVLAIFNFWRTRLLNSAQIPLIIAITILMGEIIIYAGGPIGFAIFYIIAGLPVMYLLLGFRTGIIITLAYYSGILIRLLSGGFGPHSIYQNPLAVNRTILVIGLATALGIVANICFEYFVSYITRLAFQDRLTGLSNRFKITEYIKAYTLESHKLNREFSIIGIKLLNYDNINANLSTQKGDEILVEISQRLKGILKDSILLGRWSGSLFMTIVKTIDAIELEQYSKNIQSSLVSPFIIDNNHVYIQFTIGICRYPEDALTWDEITSNILSIFDRKKRHHMEVYFFNRDNLEKERHRFALTEALNHADLDKEFSLMFQPKVNLNDGQCHGAEVLLRWYNPQLKHVSPAEFIPLAEETGFIRTITRWVLKNVFKQISTYTHEKIDSNKIPVYAVNLSVFDLKDHELINFIEEELNQSSFNPEFIVFEVTEGLLIDDDPTMSKNLHYLVSRGFKIAIDDFGTGYSSLSYLHKMNVHNLKIDSSFISMIKQDSENKSFPIVDAIISMGNSLGLEITAEGVETEFQANYLKFRGCHTAQGWLYSKPLSFEEFLQYLLT